MARDAAAAARPVRHLRGRVRAGGGVRRLVEGEHGRARPATTATTSARRTTRGARSPGWNAPGLRRLGLGRGARGGRARRASLRAETHEPIRVVATRPPGTRTEPAPGVVVYDIGQNLTGWAEIKVKAPAGTRGRGLLLREARRRRPGQHRRQRPRLRPAADRLLRRAAARATSAGRRASATRASSTCSSAARGTAAARGRLGDGRADRSRCARPSPRTSTLRDRPARRSTGSTGNTTWAIAEQPARASSPTRRSTRRTPGRATRSSRPGTASLLFDTERLYRKMFQDMLDAQTEQGEVPLLAPSNRNYGYVGKPAFKPANCCGATPAWDAFWFVIPWESYTRYGDRRRSSATLPGDAEVPGRLDPALDGQGRRRLRPHADGGPRRLGPARAASPRSTRSCPPPTTPTSRGSRRTWRARSGSRTDAARYERLFAKHPRATSTRASSGPTASTARRTATRSRRRRRSCRSPSVSCPTTSARRSRPGWRTTS